MEKNKVVLILSGGLDSTTLLYDLLSWGHEVYAISFNYGQKHSKELNCAKATCKALNISHKIVNLSCLNDIAPSALTRKDILVPEGHYEDETMKSTVVPNRNMVMIALATSYAISIHATDIYYGAHSGDHAIYPDCRPTFIKAIQEAVSRCDYFPIQLRAPYQNIDKAEIVSKGLMLGADYSKTWTCYNGGKKACGRCGSCTERLEAFKLNEATDPIKYENNSEM